MNDTMSLGRGGLQVSRLGVGTMTWGIPSGLARMTPAKLAYGGAHGAEQEKDAFESSIAAGVTFFDTAEMYSRGASERRLGEVARGREEAVLATKFPPAFRARAGDLPQSLEASLTSLGRARIDLYQHHYPSRRIAIPELMALMADAVGAGKVRAVGVSNYSAQQMRLAHAVLAERGVPLASNQVGYSLLDRRPEVNGVLDACRELGVTLIAYQPLASGALTGKYPEGVRPKGLFRPLMQEFRGKGRREATAVVAVLREIGERHGKTPAQVALRWLIEKEGVLPIPGAKSAPQATSNAEALTFRLEAAEVEALDAVSLAWRTR